MLVLSFVLMIQSGWSNEIPDIMQKKKKMTEGSVCGANSAFPVALVHYCYTVMKF